MPMNQTTFDPARELQIYFRISRDGTRTFIFLNSDGSAYNLTGKQFQFIVKNFSHSVNNLISLTIGSGLTIQGASNNQLLVQLTVGITDLKAKDYYWELYNIGTKETWLTGIATAHNGIFDGVDDTTTLTISTSGGEITIEIEAGGSGGGHTIQDNGVDEPQRTNLSFEGFTVADDSGNDATRIVLPIDTDPTFSNPSNLKVPATLAAKTYIDSKTQAIPDDLLPSGNYPLVLADAFHVKKTNSATANNVTIPTNASQPFIFGSTGATWIDILQIGAGTTTIVPAIGVTLNSSSGLFTSPGQNCWMTLFKTGLNEWFLSNGNQISSMGLLVPTPVKTSAYNAASGDFIPIDTTAGTVAVTLPTAPANKTTIGVKLVVKPGANNATLVTGGADVFNVSAGATSLTLSLLNQGITVQYLASGAIWYIVEEGLTLASLDARYPAGSGTSTGTNTGDQTFSDATLSTSDVTTNNVSSTKHGFAPKSPASALQFLNGAATPAFAQVKDSDLAFTDITTNNASTSAHGYLKKLPNDSAVFLDGTGAFSTPPGGGTKTQIYTASAQSSSPADAANLWFGQANRAPATSAGGNAFGIFTRDGTVARVRAYFNATGTAGSNENITLNFILNPNGAAGSTAIATVGSSSAIRLFTNAALSIAVVAGDQFELQFVCPTWVTNPTTVFYVGNIEVTYS